jgi:hypothetical protein
MKIVLILVGTLASLFGLAQFLQLLGVFGVGFSLPGIGFTALGFAVALICFQKALGKK